MSNSKNFKTIVIRHRLRLFALAVVWVLIMWGGNYALRDYWEPDEARFVYIAREMAASGDWIVPHRHNVPYADKPPLMFWLINAGEAVFPKPIGSRLPSGIGVFLSLLGTYGIAKLWCGRRTALLSVIVLSSVWQFWDTGGMGQIDPLLLGLQMMSLYLLFSHDTANGGVWSILPAFVFMGLGALAKGPVGILVPTGVCLLVKFYADRESARIPAGQFVLGLLLAAAVPLTWVAICYFTGAPSDYLHELLFSQTFSRAAGNLGHQKPFFYYLYNLPISFLPWALFIPAAYKHLRKENPPLLDKLVVWSLFVVIFFSIPASKRNLYIMLALPAMSIAIAAGWEGIDGSRVCRRMALAILICTAILFVGTALTKAFSSQIPFIKNNEATSFALHNVPAWTFVIPMLVAAGGLAAMARLRRGNWPLAFALTVCMAYAAVGIFVLPAFNHMKTPEEIKPLADKYLPEGGRLLLYDIRGEILALNSGHMGTIADDDEEMQVAMAQQGAGLAVFLEKQAGNLYERFSAIAETGEFRMGSKKYVWAAFRTL